VKALLPALREEVVTHRRNLLSNSAKTSCPATAMVPPESNLLIRSRISASHAASTPASALGSTLLRMRSARAKRWSSGSSNASAATSSSDFMTEYYRQPARLTSHPSELGEGATEGSPITRLCATLEMRRSSPGNKPSDRVRQRSSAEARPYRTGPIHERGGTASSPLPLPTGCQEAGTKPSPPLAARPHELALRAGWVFA